MSTSIGNAGANRHEQSLGTPQHLYLQIRELPTRCSARDMRVGDRLPSEKKLRDQFGVSRETWPGLESDGIISRTRRQETFVVRRPWRAERRVSHLSYDFPGFKVDTKARGLAKGSLLPQPSVPAGNAARQNDLGCGVAQRQPFVLHEALLASLVARQRGGWCDLCSEPHRERAAAIAEAADTAH